MRSFETIQDVAACVGQEVGASDWITVTQQQVNQFAEATGDHQWIHVDPERAKDGPFGATIAHGYLTVALSNRFLPEIVEVRGFSAGVNYGVDKIRFPTPVRVGDRVRGSAVLDSVDDVAGGVQTHVRITIEIEGGIADRDRLQVYKASPPVLFENDVVDAGIGLHLVGEAAEIAAPSGTPRPASFDAMEGSWRPPWIWSNVSTRCSRPCRRHSSRHARRSR